MLSPKQLKWILAVMVLIVTMGMVQITLSEVLFLPLVIVQATPTPTITPSPSPSVTPTPTATPDGVMILGVFNSVSDDPLDEYISIYNYDSSSENLTGWFIRDDGPNRYDFPANFYIGGRQTVRIWTKAGASTTSDLYWGKASEVWNDFEDCAYLRDDSDGDKLIIDIYCYVKNNDGLLLVTRMP